MLHRLDPTRPQQADLSELAQPAKLLEVAALTALEFVAATTTRRPAKLLASLKR
jgi:hypothetical protein